MHYVKQFEINGVATKQVACIELHGKPNAATEGYLGVLGIDLDSPLHEVYKCVAVNGSVYSWELLSSGMSIMSAMVSGNGVSQAQFPYDKIRKPATYVIKTGDLLLDSDGYLYQIDALNVTYCETSYTGTQVVAYGHSAYDLAVLNGYRGTETEWLASLNAVAIITNLSVSSDASAWVEDTENGGYYQMIPVEGITSEDVPIVDVVLGADVDANDLYLGAWSKVTRVVTADDYIVLYANQQIPESAFTMQVKVFKGDYNGDFNWDNGGGGGSGEDGITPLLRINSTTNEWEVSYNNGLTYTSLGVKATGDKGDKGDKGEQGVPGAKGADGSNGADGKDGKDGYTPVKGVDYYTEADKSEMVQAVINALPNGDEVNY